MNIVSPLTFTDNVEMEKTISVQHIIEKYQEHFSTDVSRFFPGLQSISLYKCKDTGYRFFTPFNTAGDGKFYEHFQNFDWYYMDWKWEHTSAINYINAGDKVLEVGCGTGNFLKRVQEKGAECLGLELNEKAVESGLKNNIRIIRETIEQHAEKYQGIYDVVCSFQVLEHISDVNSFISGQLKVLKPGGLLMISVPNNASFLGMSENYLNLPPHHMGLWTPDSLSGLTKIFSLKLVELPLEPLQKYHHSYFIRTIGDHYAKKWKAGFLKNLLSAHVIAKGIPLFPKTIKAFTMQAVFKKI